MVQSKLTRSSITSLLKNNSFRMRRGGYSPLFVRVSSDQVTDPAIYFLLLDCSQPTGGNRVIYRHIDILNAAGIRAFALHQRLGFRYRWFENSTAVCDAANTVLGPRDLLVVPEPFVDSVARFAKCPRHVVLNQNPYLTWSSDPAVVTRHYQASRSLLGVISTSDFAEEFSGFSFPDLVRRRVRLSVDTSRFFPGDGIRPQRIAYMPRRGEEDVVTVVEMLRSRAKLHGWEIRALRDLTENEVADELRRARIFLATSPREGFGLPPLEAMASGCYLVGYHAVGGKEFMLQRLCSPVDPGDIIGLARALEAAVDHESCDSGWCIARGLEAAEFVREKFSPQAERADVIEVYGELFTL